MRQVTASEKFKAVNEGKLAKSEFVRQMRQLFPNYISPMNGFTDSVRILKNRGLINEETGVDTYDSRYDLNISSDSIDRGVRYELQGKGIDPTDAKQEDFDKVKDTVIKNLKKDPLHYILLVSGESNKVDKNDKPKEVKRGAADKDTFNDLKKATLKEGYTEEQINSAIQRLKEKKEAEKRELPKSFADQEKDQIEKDAMKAKGMIKEKDVEPVMNSDEPQKLSEIEAIKLGIDKGYTAEQIAGAIIKLRERNINEVDSKIGSDFKALKLFLQGRYKDEDIQEYINSESYKDAVNQIGSPSDFHSDWIQELADYFGDGADAYINEKDQQVNERVGSLQEFISLIEDRAAESGFEPREEAAEVIEAIADHYKLNLKMIQNYMDSDDPVNPFAEGQKKDHDGDGDIDSDDYLAAKDKAIKKAMGKNVNEAIKAIISKVLEEGTINEAATNELARLADEYAGFEGMKSSILDLQNIVTDIESYYDKTRDKIQKVYDRLGEIRNEEGLKVGGFLAPAIESAFNKDLRPISKQGFTKGLDTPKVKTLSQADIDAARAAGDIEEEPKQTMFTPVNENIDSFSDVIQVVGVETVEDALKAIKKYENEFNDGPVSVDQAKKLVADLRATDEDEHDKNISNLIAKAFDTKLKRK